MTVHLAEQSNPVPQRLKFAVRLGASRTIKLEGNPLSNRPLRRHLASQFMFRDNLAASPTIEETMLKRDFEAFGDITKIKFVEVDNRFVQEYFPVQKA